MNRAAPWAAAWLLVHRGPALLDIEPSGRINLYYFTRSDRYPILYMCILQAARSAVHADLVGFDLMRSRPLCIVAPHLGCKTWLGPHFSSSAVESMCLRKSHKRTFSAGNHRHYAWQKLTSQGVSCTVPPLSCSSRAKLRAQALASTRLLWQQRNDEPLTDGVVPTLLCLTPHVPSYRLVLDGPCAAAHR